MPEAAVSGQGRDVVFVEAEEGGAVRLACVQPRRHAHSRLKASHLQAKIIIFMNKLMPVQRNSLTHLRGHRGQANFEQK
jgi:recombination DNA repair RAD52 pathway protein